MMLTPCQIHASINAENSPSLSILEQQSRLKLATPNYRHSISNLGVRCLSLSIALSASGALFFPPPIHQLRPVILSQGLDIQVGISYASFRTLHPFPLSCTLHSLPYIP